MRITSILIIVSVLLGCTPKQKKSEDFKIVSSWHQKQLFVPDSLVYFYPEQDSLNSISSHVFNGFKVITFINGSCPDCIYELDSWLPLVEEIKSVGADVLFVVHYNSLERFKNYLKETNFNQPLILDEKNVIFVKNNLPSEKKYHCLLLDAHNKTVLIGNPLLSQNLKDLFMEQLTCND